MEDLGKSWVFVKTEKQTQNNVEKPTKNSAVQELGGEIGPQTDSDTESISVISESACSVKSDDDDSSSDENKEEPNFNEPTIMEEKKVIACVDAENRITPYHTEDTSQREKMIYFVMTAFGAIAVIGFSLVVEWYLQDVFKSNLDAKPRKLNIIKENDMKEFSSETLRDDVEQVLEAAIIKKSDYLKNTDESAHAPKNKLHKSKSGSDKRGNRNDDFSENCLKTEAADDNVEMYKEKLEKLKAKEDYLREKEKFLVMKEHDLLQKQIKFDKDLRKQHDRKKPDTIKQKKNKETNRSDMKNINKKHQRKNHHQTETSNEKRNKHAKEKIHKENISGQWYIDLYEARNNMRKRKRVTLKNSKPNWYFRWMFYRARVRDI